MAQTDEDLNGKNKEDAPADSKIDRNAPAGSKASLGAQSVRDGRPMTDDSVVEAMDEQDPAIPPEPGGRDKP